MQKKIMLALFVTFQYFSGCSVFGVYKVDIPQGNTINQKPKASQVLSRHELSASSFPTGQPNFFTDPLNPLRWDYIYNIRLVLMRKSKTQTASCGQDIHFKNSILMQMATLNV